MRTLYLSHATQGNLVLEGAGASRPFQQARYHPTGGEEDQLRETLDLQLESNLPGELLTGLSSLQRLLDLPRVDAPRRAPLYLVCQPNEDEGEWRSPLQAGWVEHLGGERSYGSIGVRLHLLRQNYWEGPQIALPLSNRNGTRSLSDLPVFNHTDSHAGHDSFVDILASDVSGDLPAPLSLELANQSGATTSQVYIALDQHPHSGQFFSPHLEAENAIDAVSYQDPTCSAGLACSLSWQADQEVELLRWMISPPQPERAAGRFFRLVLRLAEGGYPSDDLWLRAQLRVADSLVWEGAWVLVPPLQELVELNLVPLPPALSGLDSLGSFSLALQASCKSIGAHTLSVDFLQLSPLDGFRRLVSPGHGLPDGYTLYEDGFLGEVYTGVGGLYLSDFTAYGAPLRLAPAQSQRLYLLQSLSTGQAPADRAFLATALYRPRRRHL